MTARQEIRTKRGVVFPKEGRLNTVVRALTILKQGFSVNSDYPSVLPDYAQQRANELEFERMKAMAMMFEQTRRQQIA